MGLGRPLWVLLTSYVSLSTANFNWVVGSYKVVSSNFGKPLYTWPFSNEARLSKMAAAFSMDYIDAPRMLLMGM